MSSQVLDDVVSGIERIFDAIPISGVSGNTDERRLVLSLVSQYFGLCTAVCGVGGGSADITRASERVRGVVGRLCDVECVGCADEAGVRDDDGKCDVEVFPVSFRVGDGFKTTEEGAVRQGVSTVSVADAGGAADPSYGSVRVCSGAVHDEGVGGVFSTVGGNTECSLGGAVGVTRGKNWARNVANRKKKAENKKKRIASGFSSAANWRSRRDDSSRVDCEVNVALRESLQLKWKEENELAALKARRAKELMEAQDLDLLKKNQSVKVRAATERHMVNIEKCHATLRMTDNVPRDQLDHDVHTVFSSEPGLTVGTGTVNGCSISPDSSASMAEFRACQKELLDYKAAFAKLGLSLESADYADKELWTIGSEGDVDSKYKDILAELCPDGYTIPDASYIELKRGDKVAICSL